MFPYAHNIYYKMKEIAEKLTHVIHALEKNISNQEGWKNRIFQYHFVFFSLLSFSS